MSRASTVRSGLLVFGAYAAIAVGTVTATAELTRIYPDVTHELKAMLAQVRPMHWPSSPVEDPKEEKPEAQHEAPPTTIYFMNTVPPADTVVPQTQTVQYAAPAPQTQPTIDFSSIMQNIPAQPATTPQEPLAPEPQNLPSLSPRQRAIDALNAASQAASTGGKRALACFDGTGRAIVPSGGNTGQCDNNQRKYFSSGASDILTNAEIMSRIDNRFGLQGDQHVSPFRTTIQTIVTKLSSIDESDSVQALIVWLRSITASTPREERSNALMVIQRVSPFDGASIQRTPDDTQYGAAPSTETFPQTIRPPNTNPNPQTNTTLPQPYNPQPNTPVQPPVNPVQPNPQTHSNSSASQQQTHSSNSASSRAQSSTTFPQFMPGLEDLDEFINGNQGLDNSEFWIDNPDFTNGVDPDFEQGE